MFPNIEISSARQLFDVRYWGLYRGSRGSAPTELILVALGVVLAAKMAAKGLITESLTCTSGSVDLDPLPKFSAIAGMSGALAAMTRGLALDIAPVRANCIASGLVDTEMHQVRAPMQ
jgi:NAD(P)-dependent dehydrogenase (short-subunit alcohol dehydrogenase family)